MDFSKEIDEESIKEVIIREIASREEAAKYSIAQRMIIEKRVFNSLRKLDILQELMEDDEEAAQSHITE